MVYGFAIMILVLAVDLITDYRLWLNNKPVKHISGGFLRIFGLAPAVYLLGLISFPMVFFVYWAAMDTGMALLIGEKFYYTGKTSWLDRLQNDFKPLKWAKYILAVITLITYLYVRIS